MHLILVARSTPRAHKKHILDIPSGYRDLSLGSLQSPVGAKLVLPSAGIDILLRTSMSRYRGVEWAVSPFLPPIYDIRNGQLCRVEHSEARLTVSLPGSRGVLYSPHSDAVDTSPRKV